VGARRYVNLFIEPNPNCPEGCSQRFQAVGEPRMVRRIRYSPGTGASVECVVEGALGPHGGAGPARAVSVEDSGAGVVTLVYGGDWGLRLRPCAGGPPIGEPYLLVDDDAILE
jgi:hypothetical protein